MSQSAAAIIRALVEGGRDLGQDLKPGAPIFYSALEIGMALSSGASEVAAGIVLDAEGRVGPDHPEVVLIRVIYDACVANDEAGQK